MARKIFLTLILCLTFATVSQAEYYAVLIVGDQPDTTTWLGYPYYNWLYDAFWNDLFLT